MAKHRGTYQLQPIVYSTGAQMLHIPRPGFLQSSSVLIYNGTCHRLPWLAHYHGQR